MRAAFVAACLLVAVSPRAGANGTTAEPATGGLNVVTTQDVEMQSEILFASARKIEVVILVKPTRG